MSMAGFWANGFWADGFWSSDNWVEATMDGAASLTGVSVTGNLNGVNSGSYLVLKLTSQSAVIAFRGGQSTRIVLSALSTTNQAPNTPIVNIKGMAFSLLGSGNSIVRNSKNIWVMPASAEYMRFEGWSDNQENTSDITVNIGGSGGTMVLELIKKGGYSDEQHNPLL